jgi:hypothetical protein
MKKAKRREKEDCKWFDAYDPFITCNHPRRIACVCTKACSDFKPDVKPFIEK